MFEDCKGCSAWESELDTHCVPHHKGFDCPCINCIIKCMCEKECKACEQYIEMIVYNREAPVKNE